MAGAVSIVAVGCDRDENAGAGAPEASGVHGAAPVPAGSMPMRRLGRTGETVSALGLGGFHIGEPKSTFESVRLIRSAIDGGITFLDNCWDYHEGESEARMGRALAEGYRRRVFLMTKIDGRTAAAAVGQLDQSLARLNTDVIDLVQIHEVIRDDDPERCFAEGGAIEGLRAAQKAGKLRYIGFTGHKDPSIHLAMLDAARSHDFTFDAVQMPLNVMDAHYRSFEKEVLPRLVAEDIAVLGMKSMGSGDILRSGLVTAEECLSYALSLPTSVVICGMATPDVLDANLTTLRTFRPLDDARRAALLARTAAAAGDGNYERFKTTASFDATERNRHWLEEARI